MKLYFAGPLFTRPERDWNDRVANALRAAGHEVFLPQEQEPGKDAASIFATDIGGLDWSDAVVAIMIAKTFQRGKRVQHRGLSLASIELE